MGNLLKNYKEMVQIGGGQLIQIQLILAQNYKIEDKRNFHIGNFMKEMYFRRGLQGWLNGKYKVIGTGHQRIFNGKTQPFIQGNLNVEIKRNEPFFISGAAEKKRK